MTRRPWPRSMALAALVFAIATGCATAPPPLPPARALQPGDLRTLAGVWEGTTTGAVGASTFAGRRMAVRVTLAEDGTFTSIVDNLLGQGTARVADGKLAYEGAGSRGTATLHEVGGRSVLRGEGTMVGLAGWTVFELVRR